MKNKNGLITGLLLMLTIVAYAQEGFYFGAGLNSYFGTEEISNQDGSISLSHSTHSPGNGGINQSLGHYGIGLNLGFRKRLDSKAGNNLATIDIGYYLNQQDLTLQSQINDLVVKTKAINNHGYRMTLGHDFGVIHPYIIVQAFNQRLTPGNSMADLSQGVFEMDDSGNILDQKLSTSSGAFNTDVYSFIGGFGLEVPILEKWGLIMEYMPMKHIEYGLKGEDDQFAHALKINQLSLRLQYYFFNPF